MQQFMIMINSSYRHQQLFKQLNSSEIKEIEDFLIRNESKNFEQFWINLRNNWIDVDLSIMPKRYRKSWTAMSDLLCNYNSWRFEE